jgi:hypothetical protein
LGRQLTPEEKRIKRSILLERQELRIYWSNYWMQIHEFCLDIKKVFCSITYPTKICKNSVSIIGRLQFA